MNQYAANQGWWRGPDVAGGLLYNNLYGYQDADAVRNMYTSYGQPMSNEQFASGNYFTPQTEQDWSQYYPDLKTDSQWTNAGYTWDGSQWVQGGGGSGGTGSIGGSTVDTTGTGGDVATTDYNTGAFNNFPTEWLQASGILGQTAATGNRTQDPSQWYDATNVANQMAYNGMPTDVDPWYQSAKQQTQYDIADAIKNANEQSGVSGTRWSSVNNRNAQDIGARAMTTLGTNYAQQAMSAQEAARSRQQQAVNQLQSLGASSAGLSESAADRSLSATNSLASLGSLFAQYPLTVAQQASNMGSTLQSGEQSQIDAQKTEAFRQFAENNPWLQYVMGLSTAQGTPTQYQSGCMG
jgi:hypothetical protein